MWFHIMKILLFSLVHNMKNTGQRSCSYFGSGHTWSFFQQIFFMRVKIWPLLWLSPPSRSAATPLASIILEPGYLPRAYVRVLYMRGSVALSLAQLRAEKADISGGSILKRILFLASHCRRGWREWCIVGEWVERKKQGRGRECSHLPWDKDKTCMDKPLTPLVRITCGFC